MNHIKDNIWIGSWKDAENVSGDPSWVILTVASDAKVIGNYWCPITDPGTDPQDEINFSRAIDVLEFVKNREKVLVHCQSGVNRSVAVVISYLLRQDQNLSLQDAYTWVESKRPHVRPIDQQLKFACQFSGRSLDNFVRPSRNLSEHETTIDNLYQEILSRPADPDGLTHYGQLLSSGRATVEAIRQSLHHSDEYKRKHP